MRIRDARIRNHLRPLQDERRNPSFEPFEFIFRPLLPLGKHFTACPKAPKCAGIVRLEATQDLLPEPDLSAVTGSFGRRVVVPDQHNLPITSAEEGSGQKVALSESTRPAIRPDLIVSGIRLVHGPDSASLYTRRQQDHYRCLRLTDMKTRGTANGGSPMPGISAVFVFAGLLCMLIPMATLLYHRRDRTRAQRGHEASSATDWHGPEVWIGI